MHNLLVFKQLIISYSAQRFQETFYKVKLNIVFSVFFLHVCITVGKVLINRGTNCWFWHF